MIQLLFTKTPLAYFVASLWRDEAFSYLMAKLPLHTLLWSTAQDANPPLYYLLLKLWMSLFGHSEVALRSLSLIFFWATLYVMFLIMHRIYKLSTNKSLFYLLLFMMNPLLHYYAFEARMYSMMAFFASLLFYFLMKKEYKLYAYTALAALFTHYFLLVVILFQAVYIVLTTHITERNKYIHTLLTALRWYLPWVIVLIFARPPVGGSFWIATSSWKSIFLLPAIMATGYEQGAWVIVSFLPLISLLISVIVGYGIMKHWRMGKKSNFFLIVGWALGIPLVIFIISFLKPVFLPRYLIFSSVGLTLLIVLSLESMRNVVVRSLFILAVVISLFSYSSVQVVMRKKAELKKTFFYIGKEMRANDVVYVTHEYDFHPSQYYLPNKKIYIYKKTYEELPWFVGKVLIDKQAFRNSLPIYPERAFIINNDGSYSVQSSQ